MNKLPFLAFFAHPDDESFGAGGLIVRLTEMGHQVDVICATSGGSGKNHSQDQEAKLEKLREAELMEASKILGVRSTRLLQMQDGELCNNNYHELYEKIALEAKNLYGKEEFNILTFHQNGISGHIDHIVVSMVATFFYEKNERVQEIWYLAKSEKYSQKISDYFIHYPSPLPHSAITVDFDNSVYFEKKKNAMLAHKSQVADANRILARSSLGLTHDCVIVHKKSSGPDRT